MKLLTTYLKEALNEIPRTTDLVDRIMTLLSRVSLTKEILDLSKVSVYPLRKNIDWFLINVDEG